jgi:hypothetical protein
MCHQDRLYPFFFVPAYNITYDIRICLLSPWKIQFLNVSTKLRRDFCKPVSKNADGNRQDLVTGGNEINNCRFHSSGTGSRKDNQIVLGLINLLNTIGNLCHQLSEFRSPVIDHRLIHSP